jgi:hypothetical protein
MRYIDFDIIQSSIDHGRLYFAKSTQAFFPADAFGGRGATEHASASISIEAAGETFDTDVRLSGPRVSPRKSFKTWLNAQHAVAGAKARLYQTGERTYKLEYLG